MKRTRILANKNTLIDRFVAELRDVEIQKDRMRFRRNLERIGEILAYEISKEYPFENREVRTPLGTAIVPEPTEEPVIATILRAGLPLHQGVLNYFDRADSTFISAYRMPHTEDGKFDIKIEYMASPALDNRIVILTDPMLATGSSMVLAYEALLTRGTPKHIHIVAAIGSTQGLDYTLSELPENVTIWLAAIDDKLTAHSYIVPGLGDAGDLAFGIKE
jgi:uracil phosphoribosyltransferase